MPTVCAQASRHTLFAAEGDVDVRLRTGTGDAVVFDNRLLHRGCRKSQANLQHRARLGEVHPPAPAPKRCSRHIPDADCARLPSASGMRTALPHPSTGCTLWQRFLAL